MLLRWKQAVIRFELIKAIEVQFWVRFRQNYWLHSLGPIQALVWVYSEWSWIQKDPNVNC